jgi:hypothetical protein
MKAIFGGAVKKPLMTKVSMRHLNELVRERNQYSRDALEAWQDFINLKGRMDTELSKVTKRNNFLVEELESWKQQFLKFQAFAEQLTKETQDLKVKIENHKRENRRLTSLIDQQKDDAARLTVRLSGTEKQRDDALEALVLQQEIAEELERERKRNKKELAALQHTNLTLLRQRDEAQRVVLHLRSLISGQTHHMEHIVRSLVKPDELENCVEEGFDDDEELDDIAEERSREEGASDEHRAYDSRASSRANQRSRVDSDDVTPEMEARLLNNNPKRNSKRWSQLSVIDVADRHLRERTDAIAHIIRNIADQCAAAVEGLQLAHDAEVEAEEITQKQQNMKRSSNLSAVSDDGHSGQGSETGDDSLLHPNGRASSIPPTPDLVHNRSSTSMSIASSTTTPERASMQYSVRDDIPTKIVEHSDEEDLGRSDVEAVHERGVVNKTHHESLIRRPAGARISALGGQ